MVLGTANAGAATGKIAMASMLLEQQAAENRRMLMMQLQHDHHSAMHRALHGNFKY
jgi:hypothetical protein